MAGFNGGGGSGSGFSLVTADPTGNSGDEWDGDRSDFITLVPTNPSTPLKLPNSGTLGVLVHRAYVKIGRKSGSFSNPWPAELYYVDLSGNRVLLGSENPGSGNTGAIEVVFDQPTYVDRFEVDYQDYDGTSEHGVEVYNLEYYQQADAPPGQIE